MAIKASLDRGQGGVVGEGKNIWANVEIHEREFFGFMYSLPSVADLQSSGRVVPSDSRLRLV